MATNDTDRILDELGMRGRTAPEVFRSIQEVSGSPINGHTHALRRAWKSFNNLIAVFSIRGRPTLYVQHSPDRQRLNFKEQQKFWSHGVAPMLVRVTPAEIQIYSSLRTPALEGESVDDNGRLIETFGRASESLEIRQFIRSVEAGTVYGHYAKHFDPTQAVDHRLVHNLRTTRDLMSAGKNPPDATTIHRFLGRVLFTSYLEARGALVGRDFGRLGAGAKSSFKEIMNLRTFDEARRALVGLFRRLARYFRGNLFDDDLGLDLDKLRDDDLLTLRELLNGTDLFSGQYVLPFDTYDFSVIPIETVSAVYEDFIRAEGEEEQKRKGAFYTPPKLVDFAMDLATEDQPDLAGKRILDPGCGSGVFLVSAFNRKAEAWMRQHERAKNSTRAQSLAKILREEICGIDLSPIACQATCFSLYMAMLDCLDPPEIRRLGRERLPSLLLSGKEKRRVNGPQTVIQGDFLTSLPALEEQQFDLVVGNPPWVARGNVEQDGMKLWIADHPPKRYPTPAKQVACAFMWNIPKYLAPDARACLLLPAKILLGDHTSTFQAKWFSQHSVEKVAHLSDLRFFLFPTASHPTIAIRFVASAPKAGHKLAFITPKASPASLFDNVITVEPEDHKTLALKDLLESASKSEAAIYWLGYNWASPRDKELLDRLRNFAPLSDLVGEPEENKRWNKGQGIQPSGEDAGTTTPFWEAKHLYLDADHDFDFLLGPGDVTPVGTRFPSPHRVRDERIFKSPLVLFNKGYSKIAYSPFNVLFRDALQGISGPEVDSDLLKFLTATLVSPLGEFFVFHMSSASFYRYPFLSEVLRLPFPLPDDAPGRDPHSCVSAIAKIFSDTSKDARFGSFGHPQLIEDAKLKLTEHVYAYYDIDPDEAVLIEDTVKTLQKSSLPSRGSSIPTLTAPTPDDRKLYADTIVNALHCWGGNSAVKLTARCMVAESAGVAILTITKATDGAKYTEDTAPAGFDEILSRLKTLSEERYGSLVYLRNLAVLERDRIHIVKPLMLRFWLRSAALNDADTAASQLLDGKEGRAL